MFVELSVEVIYTQFSGVREFIEICQVAAYCT
jgi:hypothetical protein